MRSLTAPANDFTNSNYATTSAHDGVVLISAQISNRQIFKFHFCQLIIEILW